MSWFRRRTAGSGPARMTSLKSSGLAVSNPRLLEQLYVNARLLSQKAYLQYGHSQLAPALDTQAMAVTAWERVVDQDPDNPEAGRELGAAYNQYAVLLAELGRVPDAVDHANLALDVLGPLSNQDPRAVLPLIHGTLGNIIELLDGSGQHGDADLARRDQALVESALAELA